ncbi:urease accessory protein UreD [Rhodobacterales bacterium HKCCE2091]|nr:urease accessory protein UreD [Rhodobacterales bacterium HKCCE2091]
MFDQATGAGHLQRATGRAFASLRHDALRGLSQAGSAKVMLPRVHGAAPEVVFLNTAGGMTGGDVFDMALSADGGTVAGTSQTAERIYRASGAEPAQVAMTLTAGAGTRLHWLPQETILFDGAALHRRTEAELTGDAELVLADALVFGRQAMGEVLTRLSLVDRRMVRRDGRPVLLETVRMGDADLVRPGTAGLGDARAVAAVHVLAPDAPDRLARLRAVLPGDGSASASAWDGRLSCRILARDPAHMRRVLSRAVTCLTGAALPRVWPVEYAREEGRP